MCEKRHFWNPSTCSCKNGKYVGRIIDDSVVIYDETKDTTKNTSRKTVLTKFTLTNLYFLLSFLLITITLLIAISVKLIKY